MRILAIDTSTTAATCAILDDGNLISEYIIDNKKTHSQKIMPMIKEIFESQDIKIEDIDVFAASVGPGSFTGLRIGIATIKSFGHAFEKPVIGVPTIDALAYNLAGFNGVIVPIIDARRERVYTGIYKWDNDKIVVLREQDVLNIDELLEILEDLNEKIIFNGDAIDLYRNKISEKIKSASFAPNYLCMPKGSSVGYLAYLKAKNNEYEDHFTLTPDYLRKSQAEREYDEKVANGDL